VCIGVSGIIGSIGIGLDLQPLVIDPILYYITREQAPGVIGWMECYVGNV